MLLERTEKIADDLRHMGERAIAQANSAGVPAYFMDPKLGDGIIRRLPNGSLERVRLEPNGDDTVLEQL